jgi:hypothetical protein
VTAATPGSRDRLTRGAGAWLGAWPGARWVGGAVVSIAVSIPMCAAQDAAAPERFYGTWLREERDRVIELAPCDALGPICGRLVRIIEPDPTKPQPDPTRTGADGTPLIGSTVLQECRFAAPELRCARSYIPATGVSHSGIRVSIETDGRLRTRNWLNSVYWTREH